MSRTLLALIALLASCGGEAEAPLVVSDLRLGGASATMAAAYMTLTNNADETLTITAIESPQYEVAELHETRIENDIARMRPVSALEIPANASLVLEPGGKHLMLMRPSGDAETVELRIYSHDALLLTVQTTR